jgi:hypothetical protein
MRNPRILLAAGVVVLAIVVGVVVLPHGGGGGNAPAARVRLPIVRSNLTLEQFDRPDGIELLVSLPRTQLNNLEQTGGARKVLLGCSDARAKVMFRERVDWPLIEEPGFPPHIHVPAGQGFLDAIRSCRLTGPGILFTGAVKGRLPVTR